MNSVKPAMTMSYMSFESDHGQVKQTGAEGERMKEGAMINKSLLLGPGWSAFGSNELL